MHVFSLAKVASWSAISELLTTLGLIFGGCCSNALTLEIITSQYSPAGTLITFAQFVFVALAGLRKQLIVLPKRMKRRDVVQRVAEMSGNSDVISIYSREQNAVVTFAYELASAVRAPVSGSNNELQATQGSLPGIEEPLHVVRVSSKTGQSLSCFQVLLQNGPVPLHALDATIDVSSSSYPAFLHPRVPTFTINPFRYRLRRRKIPLFRYAFQVLLFLLISLLNNAAFSYRVPMVVHIIFRSGGLVANMMLGWAFEKRRYSNLQIASVILVTFGVMLTTLSAKQSKTSYSSATVTTQGDSSLEPETQFYGKYAIGIAILTLASFLSGILGITQDRTFQQYGRGNWEEAMFYLHFLALPLFGFTWPELAVQARTINSGPRVAFFQNPRIEGLLPLPHLPIHPPTILIPAFYIPLILNVVTQLICVAGVNRLTSRVNSLTVSLVLVVRKATSLAISVFLLSGSRGNVFLWFGAAAVLVGTIGYTMSSTRTQTRAKSE